MWPAEIVGDVTAAIERLGEPAAKFFARHPGGERRAFQFFNYAGAYGFELSNTTVVTWEEGLRMRYDAHKVKKRADAVSNARAYLETGDLSSENARGVTWWSQLAPRRDEDEDEEKTTKQRAGGKAKRKRQRVSGNDGEKDASAADEIVDETGGFKFPVFARVRARGETRRVRATAERALDGQTAAVRTHSSKFIRQRATADKASQIREHGVRVQTAAARRRGGGDANRVRTGVFE